MKKITRCIFCLALMLLALPNVVRAAYDFEVGGICYNINSNGVSVSVTHSSSGYGGYFGNIVIPSQVMWNDVSYSVTGVRGFSGCKRLTSIEIPNSVTSIGQYAFQNCTGLTSIEIPSSVTSIGYGAFSGCTGLSSIVIPNSVTYIGERAFSGCTGLTSVAWDAENITSINSNTFEDCPIKNFTFGKTVKTIPENCCNGMTNLTSIEIPNNVTLIGSSAFSGCSSLTSVVWDAENCASINFNTFQNCPIENFTFGKSVKTIPGKCCYGMNKLTNISIPNSVTSIGVDAFNGCKGLTSIEIPNSVTYIVEYAFSGCKGLTSISIPSSVTSIGRYAFSNCTGLTSIEIPNSVTSIGQSAFSGCGGLTSIEIPNSVMSIGSSAFSGCYGLTSVVWNAENNTSSMLDMFKDCPIKNFTFGKTVKTILENCCNGMTNLTSIEIPNNVTLIGRSAFSGCSSLTSVVWDAENCASINFNTFQNCPIENFTFGKSVKIIPENCCYGMNKLTNISIPNSVTSIGYGAFSGCTGLSSIVIPNSVTSIGSGAFYGCTGLTSIEIPNSITSIGDGAFYGCIDLTSIEIPNSVTSIEGGAFYGCGGLTSIEIPNSITSIGDGAFYGCGGLTSIEIPNSVTYIGNDAFSGCTGLTSIKILNGNSTIRASVLYNCKKLTYIEAPANFIDNYYSGVSKIVETLIVNSGELNDNLYNFIKNQINTLKRLDLENVSCESIPSKTFENFKNLSYVALPKNVTSIGEDTFSGCTSLTSIKMPSSVASIGNGVFRYTGLTSIEIPNSVTSIGQSAFSDCKGLTSIEIPNSVSSIGNYAFSGCIRLTSIEIPNKVASIGNGVFRYTGLTSIEIPNSVTSIGQSAFYDCKGLISITIPNGVTTIEQSVFGGCTGLTSVVWDAENCTSINSNTFQNCPIEKFTFGESVKTIPANCCYGMAKLTSIEIPSNITTIGGSAFGNCTNLQSIKILNGNATIGKNNLTNCKGLTYIEAPASLIDVAEADMGNVTNSVETLIVNGDEVNENGYKFIDNQRKNLKCLDLSGASNKEIADEAFLDFYKPKFIFLPEGTTSIGYKSFSGCVSLRFARIPSSVTDIEYNAFNDCVGLEYIYCSAETPPTVVSAFTNVDKEIPVYVPCGKVDLYKKAKGWKEFENILCIDEAKQSEEVVAEPTAKPEETSVQLTWAVEHTAGKYVVTVMQGDEVVSVLTFDPKGALIDYTTGGSSRSALGLRSADANANSFVYTVKGLSKDTEYTYSVEVFDYDGAETEKYVGQFKTLGEVAVDENKFGENVSIKDAVSVFNKTVSVNGYEPSDIRVYSTVGQPVSNPVPASGVYVVKIGGEAVKVMVK